MAKFDEDNGTVNADRNRSIQLVVDEFTDGRIPLYGTEKDWYTIGFHWNAPPRVSETNKHGTIRKVWSRNGEDHWAFSYYLLGE